LGGKITSNKSLVTFSLFLSANFEFPEGSLKVSVEELEAKEGSFVGTTQRTFQSKKMQVIECRIIFYIFRVLTIENASSESLFY
jgi:hypothetical protein